MHSIKLYSICTAISGGQPRSLDDLVRSRKVLYVGISDTPAWEVSDRRARTRLLPREMPRPRPIGACKHGYVYRDDQVTVSGSRHFVALAEGTVISETLSRDTVFGYTSPPQE